MECIKVYIADASDNFTALLKGELEKSGNAVVVGSATDGESAKAEIAALRPDVLVADVLLPELDGVSLLRALRDEGALPRTIVVSAFVNDRMAQTLCRLGVADFLPKPCSLQELVLRICDVTRGNGGNLNKDCEALIHEHLIHFPIGPNLNGFKYLTEGVRRALNDRGSLQGVTKVLYRDLARQFGTTDKCVERAIRTSIEKGWDKGSPVQRHEYFGGVFDSYSKAPTNVQFIATIAECIELREESLVLWK